MRGHRSAQRFAQALPIAGATPEQNRTWAVTALQNCRAARSLYLKMEKDVFLLLGSNQGDRGRLLQRATAEMNMKIGAVLQKSSVYQTAAWGMPLQPDFYNQVLRVETRLTAGQLLEAIFSIERALGRVRTARWSPRTIDIDILYFGGSVIDRADLAIPHPAIAKRRFTLVPLAEISPDFIHPVLQKTNAALLQECDDPLAVKRVDGADEAKG